MAKSCKKIPKDDHRFQLKHLSIDDDRHWGYIKIPEQNSASLLGTGAGGDCQPAGAGNCELAAWSIDSAQRCLKNPAISITRSRIHIYNAN